MSERSSENLSKPIDLEELCNGGTLFEFTAQKNLNENYLSDTFNELSVYNDDYEDALAGDINKGGPGTRSFSDVAKSMTDIHENGLIKKRIMKEGFGPSVTSDVEVKIHYNAFWEGDKTPFDSTYMRGVPQRILPNENELLPGVQLAILSMKLREEALFLISYNLLYGEIGCPPRIRPKADALFMIEIIKISLFVQQLNTEDNNNFSTVIRKATALHADGVVAYNRGRYVPASKIFQNAVVLLERARMVNDEEEKKQQALLIKLYTNLAVGYNKQKKYYRACSMCNELKKLTNINEKQKILFQFGRALFGIKAYERAEEMLVKALKLEPNNTEIKTELSNLKTEIGIKNAEDVVPLKTQELDNDITKEFMKEVKTCLNIFIENEAESEMVFNGIYTSTEIKHLRNTAMELNLRFEEHSNNNQRSYIFKK